MECLFELFHPNELLIIVMLSAVGHSMCPCLHEIILAGVTVGIFISANAASTEERLFLCGKNNEHPVRYLNEFLRTELCNFHSVNL